MSVSLTWTVVSICWRVSTHTPSPFRHCALTRGVA